MPIRPTGAVLVTAIALAGCGTPSGGSGAAAGACGPVLESTPVPASHVDVGTHLDYATTPPTSGAHWSVPPDIDRTFYTAADRPPVEQLVHAEEHGWTMVWYDETVAADEQQLATLRSLTTGLQQVGVRKVVAVPWTDADGPLDSGHLTLTHWGATRAYRQSCAAVSPFGVVAFVAEHAYTDSPEPDAR